MLLTLLIKTSWFGKFHMFLSDPPSPTGSRERIVGLEKYKALYFPVLAFDKDSAMYFPVFAFDKDNAMYFPAGDQLFGDNSGLLNKKPQSLRQLVS